MYNNKNRKEREEKIRLFLFYFLSSFFFLSWGGGEVGNPSFLIISFLIDMLTSQSQGKKKTSTLAEYVYCYSFVNMIFFFFFQGKVKYNTLLQRYDKVKKTRPFALEKKK